MTDPFAAQGASAIRLNSRSRLISIAAAHMGVVSLLVFCAGLARADKTIPGAEEPKTKLSYLIARSELADPFFEESVVLMLPAERMPLVVGLIVNKPTKVTLTRLY